MPLLCRDQNAPLRIRLQRTIAWYYENKRHNLLRDKEGEKETTSILQKAIKK